MSTSEAVLAAPMFRRFWLGQTVSVVGDHLVVVALALFVTDLTHSATDLGLILAAQTGPLVAFLLLGGVWADRVPRQKLIVATDVARGALHGLLAVLIFTGAVNILALILIEAGFGTAEAFFRPARTALIPQTVPERLIQPANALVSASDHAALLFGPALATALVLGVGAGWAFALDAASFGFSAVLLAGVRPRSRATAVVRRPFGAELRDGWREVRARTWVSVTIACFSAALLFGLAPWLVLGPGVARAQYGSTGVWGLISTTFGLGAMLGALLALRWRPAHPLRTGFGLMTCWPVAVALLGLGAPLVLLLVATCGFGGAFSLFVVWWETALSQRIPPAALSRVTAYDWMGSVILLPVGYAVAGPLASALGADTVLLGGSLLTALALSLGATPSSTRQLPRLAADADPALLDHAPPLP